jgi:hypothetical protein
MFAGPYVRALTETPQICPRYVELTEYGELEKVRL